MVKKLRRTQSAAFHTIYGGPDYTISALRACVLLRIILTERDREIAGPGWCVNAAGLGESQRAMENAQHWDRLAKHQPAEITIVQISDVQESPAFNGRRSFLTLRLREIRRTLSRVKRGTLSSPEFFDPTVS